MRPASVAVAVLVAVLLAGCGGGSSSSAGPHLSGSSTTSTTASTPSVTIGIICMTPAQAAQTFVQAWTAGDRAAAGRCAMAGAVTAIFANSGAGAAWTFQGCGGPDPGVPICTFVYPGGSARLTLMGTEAQGWKVSQITLASD